MIFGAARSRRPRSTPRPSRRPSAETLSPEDLPPKLIPAIRAALSTGASLLHTRLALAGIELEEEVQRFVGAAVLGVVAMVAASMALVVGTFTIVVAVAPEYRVVTMVVITAVYCVVALVAVLRVRTIFSTRPPIFSATLAELEKDKDAMTRVNREHHAAEAAREAAHDLERSAGRTVDEDRFATVRPRTDRGT